MKYNKILRVLAVAILISLLVLVIPAAPAAAGAYLSASPTEGRAGDTVTVTLTGLTGSTVVITFNYIWLKTVSLTTSPYTTSITIPTSATPGSHSIRVIDHAAWQAGTTGQIDLVTFTIISAEMDIDPDDGQVGTEVEIEGADFDSREDITVEYDGDEVDIASGDDDTDSDGDFICTIIIPESATGEHTITVIGDDSGIEVEAEFTVESEISISPTEGGAGTGVTVSGTGFKENEDITISFGATKISTTIETDTNGSFSGTFTVPTKARGTYEVEISDGTNEHTIDFNVTADASLDLTTGHVSTTLTASGNGFIAGGTVTVKYGDTEVATTTVDTNGTFSVSFDVPASQSGDHTIIVSDGTNTKQFTFTMESEAPPIPPPLLPEVGIKVETEVYFDWEDVDDPSGVTYTFQIATNKAFTPPSIVLEEKGLTSSEYTITEEEMLEPTKKEAPYYWRVKATDSAANESEWTDAGSFYVGSQFPKLEGWLLYLLMGVGAFLCGLIGFWLGKRTAYTSSY